MVDKQNTKQKKRYYFKYIMSFFQLFVTNNSIFFNVMFMLDFFSDLLCNMSRMKVKEKNTAHRKNRKSSNLCKSEGTKYCSIINE